MTAELEESVPVTVRFREKTLWSGIVEVFDLHHSVLKHCYAWSHPSGVDGKKSRIETVFGVSSPLKAVQLALATEVQKQHPQTDPKLKETMEAYRQYNKRMAKSAALKVSQNTQKLKKFKRKVRRTSN